MIFDEINTVDSPNYFFDLVELTLKGADQPSASKIRRFLQRQIAASEYDELCRLAEQQVLPTWKYEDDRVRLLVQPIPKHDTKGDPSVRPLGIYPAKSRWGGTEIAIRTSLALKAKKFKGDVGPLVIALNVLSEWGFDWDDLVEAFFGTVQVVVDVQTRKSSSARAPDGIFRGPKGPRNTRISAVLATSILPWSVARSRLHLVHNPWAKHKLSPNVLPLDSISVIDGQLERKPGVPLYAVMGLSEDWARER